MSYEQRSYPRIEAHIITDLDDSATGGEKDIEATCIDLSEGGMKVLIPLEVMPDSHIQVRCIVDRGLTGEFYLDCRAIVRWCDSEKASSNFSAGVEFEYLDSESSEVLRQLSQRGLSF